MDSLGRCGSFGDIVSLVDCAALHVPGRGGGGAIQSSRDMMEGKVHLFFGTSCF